MITPTSFPVVCASVNRLLCAQMIAGRFVTMAYLRLDAARGVLTYANAGHNPPLLVRSKPGHTRGYRHACYRFTLVQAPEELAKARDAVRAARHQDMERALRDLQPERLALQRQRFDFGGTLTETEYARKLAELERAVRRKIPALAQLLRR